MTVIKGKLRPRKGQNRRPGGHGPKGTLGLPGGPQAPGKMGNLPIKGIAGHRAGPYAPGTGHGPGLHKQPPAGAPPFAFAGAGPSMADAGAPGAASVLPPGGGVPGAAVRGGNLYTSEPTAGSVGTWNAGKFKRYARKRDGGPITQRDRRMMMRATQYSDGTPADSEVRTWLRRLQMDNRGLDTTRARQLTRGAGVQMASGNPYSQYHLNGDQFSQHMQDNIGELGGILGRYGNRFEQGIQWGGGGREFLPNGNLTQQGWLQNAYNMNESPQDIIAQLRAMGLLPPMGVR